MYDVAVIGSGFGGAVTAIMLSKLGYNVCLIEKGTLPRFALGESTNPILSKVIRYLGEKYAIPEFVSLSCYDRIKLDDLPFTCGPKELFHYFWHSPGATSSTLDDGTIPEIIVQTSEIDTQLLRAESDLYLVNIAKKYGVDYRDNCSVEKIHFSSEQALLRCTVEKNDARQRMEITARFVVDGTGHKSVISNDLGLRVPEEDMDIPLQSRSIFTHFRDVGRLEASMNCDEAFIERSPADRTRSTQHHCFDGGWFWFIPFDNGVTSVGVNLDLDRFPINDKDGQREFWEIVNRYPIIKNMLEGRETLIPYIKTGRLQFRTSQASGDRWAMLPASAIAGDAWFSTGLGHTLLSAYRLVDILDNKVLSKGKFDRGHFSQYEASLYKEWQYTSKMINGIYKSLKHFEVFKYYCFVCFMGTESFSKANGFHHPHDPNYLLLNVGNQDFVEKFEWFYAKVIALYKKDKISQEDLDQMRRFVCDEMKDYNYRDYGNPERQCVHPRVRPYYPPQKAINEKHAKVAEC